MPRWWNVPAGMGADLDRIALVALDVALVPVFIWRSAPRSPVAHMDTLSHAAQLLPLWGRC